jgi:hypothetical protein
VIDLDFETMQAELEQYERGRLLRSLILSPQWTEVLNILEDYRDKARQDLIDLAPGDPTVPIVHAAVSAIDDLIPKLKQDVQHAVDIANQPSQDLLTFMATMRQTLDVKNQQSR